MRTNILSKVATHARTFIFWILGMSVSGVMPGLWSVRTFLQTGNTVGIIAGGGTGGALERSSSGVTMVSVRLTGQTHLQGLIIVTAQSHGAHTVVLLRLGHVAACSRATCALTALLGQSHHQRSEKL